MKTLKELRKELSDARQLGRAKLAAHEALRAKETRTEAEETQLSTLDRECGDLKVKCDGLALSVAAIEESQSRAVSFAFNAGRVDDPDPVRTGGFKSMAEFAVTVRNARVNGNIDERLTAAQREASTAPGVFQQNGGASGEGFLVPPDYSKTVWEMTFDEVDLLAMCRPEPTSSNAVLKPKDETTPWGASGVQAAWRGEGAQMLASSLALGSDLITLHELYAFVAATEEVLSDAPMLENRIGKKSAQAISWKASEAIFSGTGTGQPMGFINSKALIVVNKDTNQTAKTISVSNIANMLAACLRAGGSPVWLANQDILPQLIQLTIGNVPAYLPFNQPLNGSQSPFDGYLLGHPLKFTEHANTLGQVGDLSLVNFAGYYAAVKDGMQAASSMHLFFDLNMTAFRWTFRMTGQPFLSKPVTPPKSTVLRSHFVQLQAR